MLLLISKLGVVHNGLAMSADAQLCLVDAAVKCQTLTSWGLNSKLLVLPERQKFYSLTFILLSPCFIIIQ